jgi:Zn-dependent protease with chaperone function
MTAKTQCPSCGVKIRIDSQLAGKRARCPRCQTAISMPVAESVENHTARSANNTHSAGSSGQSASIARSTADDDDGGGIYDLVDASSHKPKAARVREERLPGVGISAKGVREAAAATKRVLKPKQILAAFEGEIDPVRPSIVYRLWILIVAGVMVLLPVVYMAIIGLVILAIVYHAVHNIKIFTVTGVRGSAALKVAAFLYITPLVAGTMVVLLMLKPLFARPAKPPKNRTLDPGGEPLLHAFVDGVCGAVGSPRPARIDVDCQVNASAHREGGLLGVVGGRLVLTIGLPIVAGLSLPQFAGVLAHEFGHFSQGAGMRLYALIMRINHWFARVVYERDEWDATINGWGEDEHAFIMILGALVKLAVWLTRRVLWVLMQIGRIVSGFLSRQMEFDADRYEARMVGGETFAETMWQMNLLSLAEQGAYQDLQSSWHERRLPDNFPKLVLTNVPQIPQPVVKAFRESMNQVSTKWFDTHPASKDRIARARREVPGAGIFGLEGAATDLFRDFDTLAKSASFDLYKSSLGSNISKDQLFEVRQLVDDHTVIQEAVTASERFFLNAWNPTQKLPLGPQYPDAPADLKAAKQALMEARTDLENAREAHVKFTARYQEVRHRLYLADLAGIFLKTGVPISAADFELAAASLRAVESARDVATSALGELEVAMEPFVSAATRRLIQALSLLEAKVVADRVDDGQARRAEARALYPCAAYLGGRVTSAFARLVHQRFLLAGTVRLAQATKETENPARINSMLRAAGALHDQLQEFRRTIGDAIDYPFEHADGQISLGKFAFPPMLPQSNDINGLINTADDVLERYGRLIHRIIGRLAVTAEEVERAFKLGPIAVPERNEKSV